MSNIEDMQKRIKDIRFDLTVLEIEMEAAMEKYYSIESKYRGLRDGTELSSLKVQVAQELLKDTHRLSSNHKVSGDDDRDYGNGFVGNKDIAEYVKYLVLPLGLFPIAFAEMREPGEEIVLFKVTPPGHTWESKPDWESSWKNKVAHGSTEDEAWAMAYDLYCQ